ncbi:MAG: hypothetical protein AB1689_02415 [Thermodesulfobacteriota bacterium]
MLRTLTTLLGALFVLQGIGWLVVPGRAAGGLGMPLLDGLGRSTQIGDFGAFFLVAGATMVLGARWQERVLLHVAAALLGCAALGRLVAWAAHGADLAWLFIAVELAVTALLLRTARSTP